MGRLLVFHVYLEFSKEEVVVVQGRGHGCTLPTSGLLLLASVSRLIRVPPLQDLSAINH